MGPFILDLVLGIFFMLSISFSIIGYIIFRYRRGLGPFLMMISGIPGMTGSIIGVLIRAEAMVLADWIPISLISFSLLLLAISTILWRSRK